MSLVTYVKGRIFSKLLVISIQLSGVFQFTIDVMFYSLFTYVSTLSPFPSLIARVERALGVIHIRGNQLRIRDATLPQRLLHRLHDDDALLPGQRGALQLAVTQAPSALVRLPEHAVAPVVARRVRGLGDVKRLGLAVLLDHPVLGRPVGRGEDLDFSLGSLDADGRDDVLGVGVCSHRR